MSKFKLIPVTERQNYCCHFCRTDKSVKYYGKILNPCLTATNRFIDVVMCNKCVVFHINELFELEQ